MTDTLPVQLLTDLELLMDKLLEHYRKPEVTDEVDQLRQYLETKAELDKIYKERQEKVKETIRGISCARLQLSST